MIKIRTHYNSKDYPKNYESEFGPSVTIPDQTMSMRELLARYARGIPPEAKTPIYDGDDYDLPDPRSLDLVERQEMAQNFQEELETIEKTRKKKPAVKTAENEPQDEKPEA